MQSISKLLLSKLYLKIFVAVVIFVIVLLGNPIRAEEDPDPMIKKCEVCRKIEDRYRDVSIYLFYLLITFFKRLR